VLWRLDARTSATLAACAFTWGAASSGSTATPTGEGWEAQQHTSMFDVPGIGRLPRDAGWAHGIAAILGPNTRPA
jgi:hypothetical protein